MGWFCGGDKAASVLCNETVELGESDSTRVRHWMPRSPTLAKTWLGVGFPTLTMWHKENDE